MNGQKDSKKDIIFLAEKVKAYLKIELFVLMLKAITIF
jgi:hypothetical protein